MTLERENPLSGARDLLEGRPLRWAAGTETSGDYEGRERTLEVFNADPAEARLLLRRLRPMRDALAQAAGGPVVVVFHTTKESTRLYGDFVRATLHVDALRDSRFDAPPDDSAACLAADVERQKRIDGKPGTGSTELPRVAA